ncbi:MAG: hypothetical protein ACYTFA_05355 [Planctomycetota bacterium]
MMSQAELDGMSTVRLNMGWFILDRLTIGIGRRRQSVRVVAK